MRCSRCGTQNEDASIRCRSCGADLVTSLVAHAPPEVTEADLVRELLSDEYEILDELGRGGMAIIYKARDKQLDRDVAIKVLPFSLTFDEQFVERFQREARTAAKLEHPHIIPIYSVGKSGRVIYFVMKFLRGKPLSSMLASRGSLPPAEIRRILMPVSRALAYAHKGGIVHRDSKPDNIMFDEHGQAVVTDFGIAKAASGGGLTSTGMSIGTPHYMSPEQARAQPLDGRSDIYSLGVVAYQCLTGRVPFDGKDSLSIVYKHVTESIPTPLLQDHDQWALFELVQKMMAKSPEERFQTADDLVLALETGGGMAAVGHAASPTERIPSLQDAWVAHTPTSHELKILTSLEDAAAQPASAQLREPKVAVPPEPVREEVSPPRPGRGSGGTPAPEARTPRASGRRRRQPWRAVAGVALLLVAGGSYWSLRPALRSLPLPSWLPFLKQSPVREPTPHSDAPRKPMTVQATASLARLDLLGESLVQAVRRFNDGAALFSRGQLDCSGLTPRVGAVEDRRRAYNAARQAIPVLDVARTVREQRLYAGVDSVERLLEQTRCRRP